MTKIRLACCSPPAPPSPQAALALVDTMARRAAVHGVDLLVLPEAFLGSGYPCGVDSGDAAGRDAFVDYFKRAVDFGDGVGNAGAGGGDAWIKEHTKEEEDKKDRPGDGTRLRIEKIARDTGVFLVVGAVEKACGSLYSAVVYVCPKKGTLGKRRMIQPTGVERLIWSPAGPASLRAVAADIKGVRINLAAAVGMENYMPLVRQSLYAQNINLYLAPTVDAGDAWLALMRTVGIEGRCFVVSSSMCTSAKQVQKNSSVSAEHTSPPAVAARRPSSSITQRPAQQTNRAAVVPGVVTTKIIDVVSPDGKVSRRRKSFIMDEDGNDIVLSCKIIETDGNAEPVATTTCQTSIQEPGPPPLPPFPCLPPDEAWERRKQLRRRSSIFDENDNEIVLAKPPGADSTVPRPRVEEEEEANAPVNNHFGPRHAPHMPDRSVIPTRPSATNSHVGSVIVTPFGAVAAGPQAQANKVDGLVWADVDFDDCIRGRLDLGVRNDSFQLSVTGLDLSLLS